MESHWFENIKISGGRKQEQLTFLLPEHGKASGARFPSVLFIYCLIIIAAHIVDFYTGHNPKEIGKFETECVLNKLKSTQIPVQLVFPFLPLLDHNPIAALPLKKQTFIYLNAHVFFRYQTSDISYRKKKKEQRSDIHSDNFLKRRHKLQIFMCVHFMH